MALTIEDGSGVAGADSYASVAEAKAYATARGLTLPATDAEIEVLLRKSFDLIESLSGWKGSRAVEGQPNSWPRKDVVLFDNIDPEPLDEIPDQLIKGQCQLAFDAQANELQPTGTGQEIIREKVDVIETRYSKTGVGTITAQFNKAMAFFAPLMANAGAFLTTERA